MDTFKRLWAVLRSKSEYVLKPFSTTRYVGTVGGPTENTRSDGQWAYTPKSGKRLGDQTKSKMTK